MSWWQPLKRLIPYALASGLLVGLQQTPLVENANLLIYDLALQLRSSQNQTNEQDELAWPITVVGISERDLKRYSWPLEDTLLCEALQRLDALGAVAIGLDLYRDQAHVCLQEEVQRNPRLISIRNEGDGIAAIPGTPARQQAFNDLVMDPDRVVRRDLLHVGGQEEAVRSLPLRLLETAAQTPNLDRELEQMPDGIWLSEHSGGYQNLDAAGYQTMLPVYPPGRYPGLELADLLQGDVNEAMIRGRIVLIGSVARSLRDLFEIPHSRFQDDAQFFEVPGVELHSQRLEALQRLLQNQAPLWLTAHGWQRNLLLTAMVLLGALIAEWPQRLRRGVLLLSAASLLLTGGLLALNINGFWIGCTMPLAGLMLAGGSGLLGRGIQSQQHQKEMRRLLGQTSSPAVAQHLWEQRQNLIKNGRFAGREQYVTVLFTDTCSFTSVSEQLTPTALMEWLNRGMSISVEAVTSRDGMVNKFTGDGMLAVFGAPLSNGASVDAQQAVAAAMAIQSKLDALNVELQQEGLPPLRMRIGIHSGQVLTGSLGSTERLEYAVIGDTVNCASRLESLQKERHQNTVRVLVSGDTQQLLAALPEQTQTEPWGAIRVKGRLEPLEVIELKSTAP